ncbi:uncharacterized protein sowahb [Mastacembelus armatus]|uniref:uncharacterized protein sowahb n=1 Tax=Mastacembelus armatus TaxID=205130 RepID=UPI000E45CD70|nr:uncharacterized protein LOC113125105 [Mastacembelus armatus]
MATDFTQDTLLHFLQSSGGSVKNSDLLQHFKNFVRDHEDRDRNRELFKKFVNTLATVKQVDGVSYIVLRKKFRGQVAGDGGGCSSGPPRLPNPKKVERSTENTNVNPAVSAEKSQPKQQLRERTPAPEGHARKTVLPARAEILNNNIQETNFNQKQQVKSTPEVSGRLTAANVISRISEKTELRTSSVAEPQGTKDGQQRGLFGPLSGITQVAPVVRHQGATSQQAPVPQTLKGREACLQLEGSEQKSPVCHASLHSLEAPRRIRNRQSYKSAVSCDEEEEEEEKVPLRPASSAGAWPFSAPLGGMARAISTSSPSIIDPPAPASVVSTFSSSSSSERNVPKIYVQDMEEEMLPRHSKEWSFESGVGLQGQWAGTVLEPMHAAAYHDIQQNRQYSQSPDVQLEPCQGLHRRLSSSQGTLFSPSSDAGFSSSNGPPSGSSRGSGCNSSCEDLRVKAGETGQMSKVQEVFQQAQRTKHGSVTHLGQSKTPWHDDQGSADYLSSVYHSPDPFQADRDSTLLMPPWHLSTGDLFDNPVDAESVEGSMSSPSLWQQAGVSRRLSNQLRNRMCRSLGADLDQILQEDVRAGGGGEGSEVARLNRLHLISSSLSLCGNLSSSSLSSCSTPPHCHSLGDLVEGGEHRVRRSLPVAITSSITHHERSSRQSSVPLEPREHAWMVKGATGAWPDIYSLFREDSSLLNKQDFISGFTVLHWIAKHGDHRVLNTLWYGVEKGGLTFDINARSTCGYTPLHIAAIHGNKNIIRLLVNKFHADVKLRDMAGKKPWQYLSCTTPLEIFQLLGAPIRAALGGDTGVWGINPSWEQQQQQQQQKQKQQQSRRRSRHHLSSASPRERPLTIAGMTKVKRSSSLAAFLKHKSLHPFPVHKSDSSV